MHLTTLLHHARPVALLAVLLPLLSFSRQQGTMAVQPTGGWRQVVSTPEGEVTHLLLFSGNYFSWTVHQTANGAFLSTKGGSWKLDGKNLTVNYEFATADPSMVGAAETWKVKLKGGVLQLKGAEPTGKWEALDQNTSSPLSGPWLFSGRKRDGEITRVDMTSQPRKTMKLLTGNRFQWIAYNTETGEFFGTGGGSYTAENGVYTEKIEFFSRDNNRVGTQLKFQFDLQDGEWHHSGNSSSGQPMYEIWTRRK